MTDQHDNRTIEPEGGAAPDVAAELFAHGMLQQMQTTDLEREARVQRVLEAIKPSVPKRASVWKWAVPVAAAIVLAASLALLTMKTEPTAAADVRAAAAALRRDGDRRYEVRMLLQSHIDAKQTEIAEARLGAVIDTRIVTNADGRQETLLLVQHYPPWTSGPVTVGRDRAGEWAIAADGTVVREDARRLWPPWSLDENSPLVDSLDRLLEQLPARFDLMREPQVRQEAGTLDHIRGRKLIRTGPLPDTVDVWLDSSTRLPERIEFAWDALDETAAPAEPPTAAGDGSILPPQPTGDARMRLIVLRHVSDPALPADWFTPERHLNKALAR